MERRDFFTSLLAGGTAGMCVDLILFPLDTIKTRLQSPQGFSISGGFRGIYAGVPSTAVGSFPNAAAFFVTYETVKSVLHSGSSSYFSPVTHMAAATLGEVDQEITLNVLSAYAVTLFKSQSVEIKPSLPDDGVRVPKPVGEVLHSGRDFYEVACLIRVPSEVIKQRAQVSPSSTTYQMFARTLRQEGIWGLYRGYKSTVLREIPFSLVQFPLWEFLKDLWSWRQSRALDSWQSAVCGAFAGGFAAAVTTPLDVAKTRIMLAKAGSSTASGNVLFALTDVFRTHGITGLFAGIIPRMTAISIGGFIFLGAYDKMRSLLL